MAKKNARRRAAIPNDESKADRFKRVVAPRVMKAVKAIKVIGYCSGASYQHTPKLIQQIVSALVSELKAMESKFVSKGEGEQGFEFKD